MRALGLMSGTSMDGIDVALLDSDGGAEIQPGPYAFYPYSAQFRDQLRAGLSEARDLADRLDRPGRLAILEQYLTDLHGEAVAHFLEDHKIEAQSVDVIGFHGHTVFHKPEAGLTIQIGDGARLAELCGIDVVYDMRAADVAAGGVGAPLAPAYHCAMAARVAQRAAVLNIGGVANLTAMTSAGGEGAQAASANELAGLVAFDTGPGNALIDDWVSRQTGNAFDSGGALCAAGNVDEGIVSQMLSHAFFARPPPKAIDRNLFSLEPVSGLSVEDGAATLCEFSARAVGLGAALLSDLPEMWIVTGGGRRNASMMARLSRVLEVPVVPSEVFDVDGDAVEAHAWAYLAVRSLKALPLTFPGTTGVKQPTTGGVPSRAP